MCRSMIVLLCLAIAPSAQAAVITPDFDAADFAGIIPENLYFPLMQGDGQTLVAEGVDEDGEPFSERTERLIVGDGPEQLGVQTTAQLDRAYEDGLLVEETLDYFAADTNGTVWYFGEDVINYIYDDDDVFLETNNESAWLAGLDGALPGWIMPIDPIVGTAYFQEIAAASDALDQALIWAVGQTVQIEGVGIFEGVIVTYETSDLDPDAREFKYYAPGVGLIRADEGLSPNLTDPELIFTLEPSPVPLPAGLPLLLVGIGAFGVMRQRRKNSPP